MGIVPPYMSQKLETYYEKTGQTEKLELQRLSNRNMMRMRAFYPGIQEKPSCPLDRLFLQIAKIGELVKNKFFVCSRAVSDGISFLGQKLHETMSNAAFRVFGPVLFPAC